ncbi:MAG: hypothetical protein FJX67_13285, partial [Alphaproteobacteria bacterium]|nr:hypothetical protein [Alphaproteobacteria bacterium]
MRLVPVPFAVLALFAALPASAQGILPLDPRFHSAPGVVAPGQLPGSLRGPALDGPLAPLPQPGLDFRRDSGASNEPLSGSPRGRALSSGEMIQEPKPTLPQVTQPQPLPALSGPTLPVDSILRQRQAERRKALEEDPMRRVGLPANQQRRALAASRPTPQASEDLMQRLGLPPIRSNADLMPAAPPAAPPGWEGFGRFDRNGDGYLSYQEYFSGRQRPPSVGLGERDRLRQERQDLDVVLKDRPRLGARVVEDLLAAPNHVVLD